MPALDHRDGEAGLHTGTQHNTTQHVGPEGTGWESQGRILLKKKMPFFTLCGKLMNGEPRRADPGIVHAVGDILNQSHPPVGANGKVRTLLAHGAKGVGADIAGFETAVTGDLSVNGGSAHLGVQGSGGGGGALKTYQNLFCSIKFTHCVCCC